MTLHYGNKCTVRTRRKLTCGWKCEEDDERLPLMLRVLGDGGSTVIYGKVKDGHNHCARDNWRTVTAGNVSNAASDLERSSTVAV